MAELRWILLGLGLVLIAGIWWWGGRRSAQAPGDAALRESMPVSAEPLRQESLRQESLRQEPLRHEPLRHEPLRHEPVSADEVRTPAFEPLSIRTADFERVPVLEDPMLVNVEPAEFRELEARAQPSSSPPPVLTRVARAAPGAAPRLPEAIEEMLPEVASTATTTPVPVLVTPAAAAMPTPVPTLNTDAGDRLTAPATQAPNASERQKIVSIRVCAPGEGRWYGNALLAAFERHGLAFGRYQVFHRRHVDGRSLFCVASLTEPGTFDVVRMASEEFRGVTLFAVLPGPMDPLLALDELLSAARGLANDLSGVVQDSKGVPLTGQRIDTLRDDVARFQASLTST